MKQYGLLFKQNFIFAETPLNRSSFKQNLHIKLNKTQTQGRKIIKVRVNMEMRKKLWIIWNGISLRNFGGELPIYFPADPWTQNAVSLQDIFTEECNYVHRILKSNFCHTYCNAGESNGRLPPRTCPGCSVPEPYQSHDWALVPASPGSKVEY